MTDSVTSRSLAEYATQNRIGDHEIHVDSKEKAGPNPTATLLAAYASCYVVGLRIAAADADLPELGTVEIEVRGERDDAGDLAGIRFELDLEADLDPDDRAPIVDRALETCHVGNALRPELEAEVTFADE